LESGTYGWVYPCFLLFPGIALVRHATAHGENQDRCSPICGVDIAGYSRPFGQLRHCLSSSLQRRNPWVSPSFLLFPGIALLRHATAHGENQDRCSPILVFAVCSRM